MKVHDNVIDSYNVNLKDKKIEINTSNNKVSVDIVFTDVLAHYFENELYGSVILDIIEGETDDFIKDNERLLNRRKNCCWPIDYNESNELVKIIQDFSYSYFIISSSYGMRGWILAKSYTYNCNK